MVRIHRRAVIRKTDFTRQRRLHLEHGFDFVGLGYGDDLDEMASDWETHRRTIMRDWLKHRPLTRPWGWWRWDAPEPRRCWKNGTPTTYRGELHKGCPRMLDATNRDIQWETEAMYLERLGLVTASEARAARRLAALAKK